MLKKNNFKKIILYYFLLLICSYSLQAQNNNGAIDAAGDIAFVTYNDGPDGFAFVLLDDCPNSTSIRFIDEEWTGTAFASATGEGEVLWVNHTGSTISKGTVITIQNANDSSLIHASIGRATEADIGFSTANIDELFAVTGTRASPGTFLSFIGDSQGNTLNNTGLTNGVNAQIITKEGYYSGSTICNSSLQDCAAMINKSANWTFGDLSFPTVVSGNFTGTAITGTIPLVTSVTVPTNGTYSAGQNLDFTINFNENVTVTTTGGTPQLSITIGSTVRQATYQSGSGTSALSFRYTVQAGDQDSDGITVSTTLSLNSGTIKDSDGNNANLSLNSVGNTSWVLVNGLDDASFSYSASSYCIDASDPTPTITGETGGTFSSTSGLSINSTTGLIDVSASTPGTYTVTYTTQNPGSNSSTANVTINALDDASFNYSALSYCVNATDPTPTITGTTGGTFSSTAGLSINSSTGLIDVSASTAGTYTVTYTTSGACPDSSTANVTINALDNASFSYSGSSYCVNATDPSPTITGNTGGTFSSTSGLVINSSTGVIDVSASTAGTYTVTYTTSGTCPSSSTVSVTIVESPNSPIVLTSIIYSFNDTATTLTATAATGNSLNWYTNATGGTASTTAPTPITTTVGVTSYWVSQTNNNGCESGRAKIDVIVNKSNITGITFENASFTYDGSLKSLVIGGTLPSGTSVSYTNNGKNDVGIYSVTANINGGSNYNSQTLTANLTITKATIVGITFENESFTYDGSSRSLAIGGTLPSGTSVSYTNNGKIDVGTYSVTAIIDGGNNYNSKTLIADLTITKAAIAGITFENESFTYDGISKSLAIDGVLPSGTSVSYTNNGKTDVGTYSVTANVDGGNNYNNQTLTADLMITKAAIAGITFENASFTYDGSLKSLAIDGTLPSGTSVSYTNNGKANVGTYSVTANIDGGNNYNSQTLTADFMITKAAITGVMFENASFTYDGSLKSLAIGGTLPSGTSVSYTSNGKTDVGTYSVTANVDGGNNYNNQTLTADLTITKAAITGITFKNASFTYDGSLKSLAIDGVLPSGTSVSYINNGKTDAGTYNVTANINGGDNYNELILKASLTIKSNIAGDVNNNGKIDNNEIVGDINGDGKINGSEVAGDINGDGKIDSSEVTGDINGDGKINGSEVAGDINGDFKIDGNEITGDINGNGKIDGNEIYGDIDGDGKLSAEESKKPQLITWNQELLIECDDQTIIELEATTDSGLPITYVVEDTSIAIIEGNTVKFIANGITKITASQNGDTIYEKATSITKTVGKTQTDLISQHWEDMLIFNNTGKEYVGWQWFKNGEVITGATKQSYQSSTLVGTYYVIATTKDGKKVRTCSIEVDGAKTLKRTGIKVYPNPIVRGDNFTVEMFYKEQLLNKAVLTMYDITGKLLQSKEVSSTKEALVAPNSSGIYIIRLLLTNGRQTSKNILVK